MTPKEKAEELYNKMCSTMPHHSTTNASVYLISQQCALIAVDEMIEMLKELERVGFLKPNSAISIIEEIKQEIENL